MLTLKLFPSEVDAMYTFLKDSLADQDQIPLPLQTIHGLVLMDYLSSWSHKRTISWRRRSYNKQYSFTLGLPVALALKKQLRSFALTHQETQLLGKLDKAIVDHRWPRAQPQLIREIINLQSPILNSLNQ